MYICTTTLCTYYYTLYMYNETCSVLMLIKKFLINDKASEVPIITLLNINILLMHKYRLISLS